MNNHMSQSKDRFTRRMFFALWRPAMLTSFFFALSDMMDAIVVGQKLGAVGLATISLILPVYAVNCMFAHGLGLGGAIHYSHLLGQGKTQEASDCFHSVVWLALGLSITAAVLGSIFIEPLLALLGTHNTDGLLYESTKSYLRILLLTTPLFYMSNILSYYLRNANKQYFAGIGTVIGNICDILLNIMLVIVLDMGAKGAALSTALGQTITIGIYLPYFLNRKHDLHFAFPEKRWLSPAFSNLRAGLSTSIQYLYLMVFLFISNHLLIRLGGEEAVAVFDVIQNISCFILYLFEGIGHSMQPILSTYHGEHNRHGIQNAAKLGFATGLCTGCVFIFMISMFPSEVCRLFGIAGSPAEAPACIALRLYCIAAIFAGINILLCCYYQACENEKPAFLLETLRGAALLLPATLLCFRLGLPLFWLLFLLTEAGSLILFLLLGIGGRYQRKELPGERIFQRTISSNTSGVMDICTELESFCRLWNASPKQQMMAVMTVEEIGMAILKYGFHGRTDGYIQFTAIMEENSILELHLRDDATTFNPFGMETHRASRSEAFDIDSMGILVVKQQAKEFFYRRYHGFNTLIIKL